MKKYILLLLVLISSFFIFNIDVEAKKKLELTCVYNLENRELDFHFTHANCYFYDNNDIDCKVFHATSSDESDEDLDNLSEVKEWYKSNKKCPRFMAAADLGWGKSFLSWFKWNKAEIYLYDTEASATSMIADRGEFYTAGLFIETAYKNSGDQKPTVDEKPDELERIKGYISLLENFGKEFNLDEHCNFNEETKTYQKTKLHHEDRCEDAKAQAFELITGWNKYVDNAVTSGKISKEDNTVKKYRNLSDKSILMLGHTGDSIFTPVDDPSNVVKPSYSEEEKDYVDDSNTTNNNNNDTSRKVVCPLGPNVTKDLYGVLKIFKIVAPILVIVLSTFDAIKAVAAGDANSEMKKIAKRFGKRAIYAIILFFIPVLVNQAMILANVWNKNGQCDLSKPVSNGVSSGNTTTAVVCASITNKETCDRTQQCDWDNSNNICNNFGYHNSN